METMVNVLGGSKLSVFYWEILFKIKNLVESQQK